jgi:hypothetical protein
VSHPIDPSVATTGEAPSDGRSIIRDQRRPTIAFLNDFMDLLGPGYETLLRRGFEAACRRHDLDLLRVFGRAITAPGRPRA